MSVRDVMTQAPVIPVIVIDRLEQAIPLARALVAGGLPVLEITLRTPVALDAIKAMVNSVPEAIVGVGTVTRPAELELSLEAGAAFAGSPGLTATLAAKARELDVPFLPGVMTASEVMAAREAGFDALKLFPAQQAGGIGMLKALYGPLSDVVFCPTGGVGPDNFRDFLALPNVLCVGGSWVVPKEAVDTADWDRITQLATAASGK